MRIAVFDVQNGPTSATSFWHSVRAAVATVTLLIVTSARCYAQDSSTRVWRDVSGNFSVTAELLGSANGAVKLRLENGKEISVPIEKLSAQDRAFLAGRTSSTKRSPTATNVSLAKTLAGAPLPPSEIELADLHELLRIPVFLDIRGMERAGIDVDNPLKLADGHEGLQDQLDDALAGAELSWCTTQTALVITSKESLKKRRYANTRLYRIPTPRGRAGAGPIYSVDAVIQRIIGTVSPNSWEQMGGLGSIDVSPYSPDKYVVRQSPDVHRELEKTLKFKSRPLPYKHRFDLQRVSVSMATASIADILDGISEQINVPIEPSAGLDQVGLDLSTTRYRSRIHLESVSAKDALDLLLSQVDCTWVEDGQKLIIMDLNEAEETLTSKRFAVKTPPLRGVTSIIAVIQKGVAPDSWSVLGGEGTIAPARGRAGLLEIKQGQPAMREVEQFILALSANR